MNRYLTRAISAALIALVFVVVLAPQIHSATATLVNMATQVFNILAVANGGTGANTLASGGVLIGNGTSAVTSIDFPDAHVIPAANCNSTTAGPGWSIPSGGTATCRAGTNNLGGYIAITDTSTTFAQFTIAIPDDWDTSTDPYIRFQIGYPGTDASSHTIIPQTKVSCMKGDGSTTDDVAFAAARSASTITIGSAANQFWTTSTLQWNSTDMSGCVAGSMMIVQVGRATDTATSAAHFYSAVVTFPRKPVLQAE